MQYKKAEKSIDTYAFKRNKIDYFLFYFLFFFPVLNWTSLRRETYYVQFLLAAILTLRTKPAFKISYNPIFKISYIRVLLLWLAVSLLQITAFGRGSFEPYIGQIMFITYPFFMVMIFKEKIPHYFVNMVLFISVVSFFFYFPSLLSSKIHHLIYNFSSSLGLDVYHPWKTSFIIYTWEPDYQMGLIRNAGAFYEPGYFGCYLALALVWNLIYNKKILNIKNYILFVAIITTFSTATYLAVYFILTYWVIGNKKIKLKYVIWGVPIILSLTYYSYTQLDFMENKINKYYDREKGIYDPRKVRGRFGATFKNIEEIKDYPLTGRGLIRQTRFDGIDLNVKSVRAEGFYGDLNSWTGYMVRLGIIGFICFMVWYTNSIKKFLLSEGLNPKYFYLIMGTLLIVLASQPILLTPAFFSFIYFVEINSKSIRTNLFGKNKNNQISDFSRLIWRPKKVIEK